VIAGHGTAIETLNLIVSALDVEWGETSVFFSFLLPRAWFAYAIDPMLGHHTPLAAFRRRLIDWPG
jgi:hypothetical protein